MSVSLSLVEAPQSPITVGDYPNSVAIGDVNGDGKSDVVITNTRDDSLTILIQQ